MSVSFGVLQRSDYLRRPVLFIMYVMDIINLAEDCVLTRMRNAYADVLQTYGYSTPTQSVRFGLGSELRSSILECIELVQA